MDRQKWLIRMMVGMLVVAAMLAMASLAMALPARAAPISPLSHWGVLLFSAPSGKLDRVLVAGGTIGVEEMPSDGAEFVTPALAHAVSGGGEKRIAGGSVDIKQKGAGLFS